MYIVFLGFFTVSAYGRKRGERKTRAPSIPAWHEARLTETRLMLEALLRFALWRKSRKHKRAAEAHFRLANKLQAAGKRHWALYRQAERRLVGEPHQQQKSSSTRSNLRSSQSKPSRRQKARDLTLAGSKEAMPNGIASHREH